MDKYVNQILYSKKIGPKEKKAASILKKRGGDNFLKRVLSIRNYEVIPKSVLVGINKYPKLGKGSFGSVYSYKDYAIKVIKDGQYTNIEFNIGKTLIEKIYYPMYSPNILLSYQYTVIKPRKSTKKPATGFIVFEKLDTTLFNYMTDDSISKISRERVLRGILLQILFTLSVIKHVIPSFRHNDLKSDNILLDFSKRKKDITLKLDKNKWVLPKDIPLVKLSDFDYAGYKGLRSKKVNSNFAKEFGVTKDNSSIYDLHSLFNNIYHYKEYLPKRIVTWIEKYIPKQLRGKESRYLKYFRLKDPSKWEDTISTPENILKSPYFKRCFGTNKLQEPWFGL